MQKSYCVPGSRCRAFRLTFSIAGWAVTGGVHAVDVGGIVGYIAITSVHLNTIRQQRAGAVYC